MAKPGDLNYRGKESTKEERIARGVATKADGTPLRNKDFQTGKGRNYMIGQSGAITPMAVNMPSYKKGGKVKKTGLAKVHKGEIVIPVNKAKRLGTADGHMMV